MEKQQKQQWIPLPQEMLPKQHSYEKHQQHKQQHQRKQYQLLLPKIPPLQQQHLFDHQQPCMSLEQPSRKAQSISMSATKPRFMPPVLPESLETEQEPRVYVNEYGQTIKMRKKPGRKPNPAPPALRREQNRTAQRVFRKRKENRLHELENTIRTLREQRNRAIKDLGQQKKANDALKAKNWYLRGLVMTLHFICMYNNVAIPEHSPYLSEEDQNKIAEVSPCAAKAYSDVVRRNNVSLDPTVALDFSDYSEESSSSSREQSPASSSEEPNPPFVGTKSKGPMAPKPTKETTKSPNLDGPEKNDKEDEIKEEKNEEEDERKEEEEDEKMKFTKPPLSSVGVIQWIRLYLRVQTTFGAMENPQIALRPTLLQLAVHHDPRVDLVPIKHLRDRMIAFDDIIDYDELFELVMDKAIYKGGDPTVRENYDLP
ncbi:hypothetical protein DFQ28_000662 [Apophysomyces sp. BC1034]|nr:hypothetical protein DFQ30_000663 [Apophysomyces sp. BC1015]KAG0179386.1 hypothetical protein DFQ29_002140 [Apophysomyces sp. BC1021]KAG0179398.1 hypothetical protein DFQ29_002152 [Apophysomyces sp. BC1021]KAG0191267.1 hypothetical protein DFQ28_000662 [Apophysomyces sp. BC1034]